MTKTINTLIQDLYDVIDGKGGWDETISEYFRNEAGNVVDTRLQAPEQERGTLRMSNLGSPCKRKLWYTVNRSDEGEHFRPPTKLKFLYGDLLEALLLSLCKAAGHDVQGEQSLLEIGGIKGHRDAVIDGITVDVKSASSFAFRKFKDGNLPTDDPFDYISQLSSYVYAGRNGEVPSHPTVGAFLVINKESGELCLDSYSFESEIEGKEEEVANLISMVAEPSPPDRAFAASPDGKSGNMKLGTNCSYCAFKKSCWPNMRTFLYSNGPRYLVDVRRLPQVPEV